VPFELLGRTNFPLIGEGLYLVTLGPYGFFWFLLREPEASMVDSPRIWAEFETLVVTDGWRSLLRCRSKSVLERVRERQNPSALAAVRRGPREGSLLDAAADPGFVALVLENLRAARTIEADHRRIEFAPTASFPKDVLVAIEEVRAVDTEQSNTTVLVGTDYVVKLFRRLEPGLNPEIEVGHFLTETVAFPHAPPLLGTVELEENGARSAVAVVHGFVQNQGDAWTVTTAYLDRFVEEQRLLTAEAAGHSDEQTAYLRRMDHVGRRVAELQLALASRNDIVAFAPEPIAADDVRRWTEAILQRAGRALGELARRCSDLAENDRQLVDALLSYRDSLPLRLRELLPETIDAMKIRHHGDFHLGQMLIVKDDISIIDFEGEPRRSLEDRRRKAPAARDVAGLIRSIDYSATAALERALKAAPDEHGKSPPRSKIGANTPSPPS